MSVVTIVRTFKKVVETKYGSKPSLAIKTEEHGDKWLSTFKVTSEMDNWKEGDKVTINIQEKGGFLNFDTIGVGSQAKSSSPASGNSNYEDRIKKLEDAVFGQKVPDVQVDALEEVDPFEF